MLEQFNRSVLCAKPQWYNAEKADPAAVESKFCARWFETCNAFSIEIMLNVAVGFQFPIPLFLKYYCNSAT